MEEKILKILSILGLIILIVGIGLGLYSEAKEETVQVVPVPKTETVTTYPYLVPGIILAIPGGIILLGSLYYLSLQKKR